MKSVSVRELRSDFKTVERLLREGEDVQITKRRKVIGRIIPEAATRPPLPDFLSRIRALQGDTLFQVPGAQLLRADRNRY
jgi:antitoxin (DNA-binding transcriptional repressor) of toxin-antitoxin stability system